MAIFCFSITQTNLSVLPSTQSGMPPSDALDLFYCILTGCLCSFCAFLLFFLLANYLPVKKLKARSQRLIHSLYKAKSKKEVDALHRLLEKTTQSLRTINIFKAQYQDDPTSEYAHSLLQVKRGLYTRALEPTESLENIEKLVEACHLYFTKQNTHINLEELYQTHSEQNPNILQPSNVQKTESPNSLPTLYYHLHKLCLQTQEAVHPPKQSQIKKKSASYTNHFIFSKKHPTIYFQSSLRSSLSLLIAYIVSLSFPFQIPAWVLASTNTVSLFQQGHSTKKGLQRIIGHLVGLALTLLVGYFIWPYFDNPIFWTPFLMLITCYFCLINYFIYCVFLISIITYLFLALHLINPEDFSLLHVVSTRTLDIIVGSVIAVILGILLPLRFKGGLKKHYSDHIYKSYLLLFEKLQKKETLSKVESDRLKEILFIQTNGYIQYLQGQRYQWGKEHISNALLIKKKEAHALFYRFFYQWIELKENAKQSPSLTIEGKKIIFDLIKQSLSISKTENSNMDTLCVDSYIEDLPKDTPIHTQIYKLKIEHIFKQLIHEHQIQHPSGAE